MADSIDPLRRAVDRAAEGGSNDQEIEALQALVEALETRCRTLASTGSAVLDSECGTASLGELARAIKDADYGDWTEHFPYITSEG